MIRFKTIDPAEQAKTSDKTSDKPAEKPAPAVAPPALEQGDGAAAGVEEPAAKSKGMTRKAPLRAKKPAASGLFRD